MKCLTSLALALVVARATPIKRSDPLWIDISDYQTSIDWTTVVDNGIWFVYIKAATEGTSYKSPTFNSQYIGTTDGGLIRGSYHIAQRSGKGDPICRPATWQRIRQQYHPERHSHLHCREKVCSWIKDFSNTYEAATPRYPVIYTTTDWWTTCTGSVAFAANNPLWIADWSSTLDALPAGWGYTSFWQYADSGPNPPGLQRYFFLKEAHMARKLTSAKSKIGWSSLGPWLELMAYLSTSMMRGCIAVY
ncbi:glycoside hydrolase superfamily [Boletus edulis BED1]|uniref:Glycoside hydrolase superfamily n=1 Tax=Boletus edulis BED1 TaxID=1328754 RepID=A0AAD4GAN2_BOLED|nr:glycoside hydrolase superfamily [Boletus edulis BED1]